MKDVYLKPGEFWWGDKDTVIRTLLGSCVSLCFWHPRLHIGGMCHFMLPARGAASPTGVLDSRYADEAMELFLRNISASGTKPPDYVVKIFGGAQMNFRLDSTMSIAVKNIAAARKLIQEHRLNVVSENVGGTSYRRIHFELWTGNVWMKRPRETDSGKGNKNQNGE